MLSRSSIHCYSEDIHCLGNEENAVLLQTGNFVGGNVVAVNWNTIEIANEHILEQSTGLILDHPW